MVQATLDPAAGDARLSVIFERLSEADPASARDLLVNVVWKRDWSRKVAEDYFAWRYEDRANGETLVATDRGRCVGILDSFTRPYWIAGRRQVVRETCDWFCLPEYRAFGVGLHLMRRMMAKPEPILVVGGTEHTRNLLPRLKWARLPEVGNFILGISAKTVAGLVAHKRWRGGIALARAVPDLPLLRKLRPAPPPSANCSVGFRAPGEGIEAAAVPPYALSPVLGAEVLDWFAHAPAVLGQLVQLSFHCEGELVGIALCRLEELESCGRVARIVHLHAKRVELIDWMAGAAVAHLIEQGAGVVLCRASCPATTKALAALGFWRLKTSPAYWWPAVKLPPSGAFHLTTLQADDALQFT